MKKLLAVLLAVLMIMSLVACGGEETVTNTDEDITIVWYVPGDKQADVDLVNEAASEISMKEIGVKVKLQFIDTAAFTQRMNMNFASGNSDFDICFTGYINPYKDTVAKGAYVKLDDYIAKSDKIKEAVPDYALKCSTAEGGIYAIPNMQIMATGATGLFVLEDLAKEYGLNTDEIKSLNDIEPFLAWVKEKHPELYPFKTGGTGGGVEGTENFRGDSPTGGATIRQKADGSLYVTTPLDEIEKQLTEAKLIRDWYEKGYI